MAAKRDPWMKFYPTDWRSDPKLRICSAAARGLWLEMMCLMHEAEPYGHLLVSGQRPTDEQLAVLAGIPSNQLPDLIGELDRAGVFSRTAQGTIYSRRMTRDEKKRRTARQNGKFGGNPSLRKETGFLPLDNPQDKGGDKTQRPEARGQKNPPNPPSGGKRANGRDVLLGLLGQVVSAEQAGAFIAHRKAKRRPLTERAAELVTKNLEAIKAAGGDPARALDLAIEHGWDTIKPDWYQRAVQRGEVTAQPRASPAPDLTPEQREHYEELARQRQKERQH